MYLMYLRFVFYIPENSHIVGRNMYEFIMCINGLKCICVHLLVPFYCTKADKFIAACRYSI